ncbi:enoyl-CoA hydratase/isomerase family protein [Micromonospora sp. NPDC005113]
MTDWKQWQPDDTSFESIVIERAPHLARLTFNNPDKLNALTRKAFAEVTDAVTRLNAEPDVRVLIITGTGRGFCSGADVSDLLARRAAEGVSSQLPDRAGREVPLLAHAQMPVIAAVNGPAAGAGLILALLADFRVASESAFFVESHVARGLTPSVGAWLLPKIVGLGLASEMVLLGRRVYAQEALAHGLVTRVVPDDELLAAAEALAAELIALPRFALLTARGAIRRGLDHSMDEVREWAGAMEALSLAMTDEAGAGSAGFGKSR